MVALALGFRPDADVLHWIAAAGVLLGFVAAVSWFAAAIGLLARSPEPANGLTFFIVFLSYASSAFVPVHTMPHRLQGFARHQPIAPLTRHSAACYSETRLDRTPGSGLRGARASWPSRSRPPARCSNAAQLDLPTAGDDQVVTVTAPELKPSD